MNILDENVPDSQRRLLGKWRIRIRQIGVDIGRKGIKDHEIIPLLHQLDRPTFLTLDSDFFHPALRHRAYCLIHFDIEAELFAEYTRRILRHPRLNTRAKRMGQIMQVSETGLSIWRVHEEESTQLGWKR
jgi:hypothetical protein